MNIKREREGERWGEAEGKKESERRWGRVREGDRE